MSLQLIPLSDENIAKHKYQLCDLWMIKYEQDIIGPFHTSQIQEEIATKNPILEECLTYNLESEQWRMLYKWPIFQRRIPQLIPAVDLLTDESFFVLINGQKEGPHTLGYIKEELDAGKLSYTDLISNTEGKSWTKLGEHAHFDRRKRAQKPLPGKPTSEIFSHGDKKIVKLLTKKQLEKEQEDALISLAFMVHDNENGQTSPEQQKSNKETSPSPTEIAKSKINFNSSMIWDLLSNLNDLKENKTLIYSSASIGLILLFFTIMNSFNNSFENNQDMQIAANDKIKKDIKLPNNRIERKPAAVKPTPSPAAKAPMTRLQARNHKSRLYKKAPAAAPKDEPKKDNRQEHYADEQYQDETKPYDDAPVESRYPDEERYPGEEAVAIDVEDPAVRENISRELASDIENENLTDQERKDLELKLRNEIDNEAERYLEERADQYEQVSDFE